MIFLKIIKVGNWYDKIYFSQLRNCLTKTQAKILLVALSVIFFVSLISLLSFPPGSIAFAILCLLSAAVFIFTVLYFFVMWCWTYKKTNMMLSPEGGGKWSTHMGLRATLFPSFYARLMVADDSFMDKGRIAIAKAAQAINFPGTIVLKGHLHGVEKIRENKVEFLRKELCGWEISHQSTNEILGSFYACVLTRHRNCYLKRAKLPIKLPLSPNRSIGIIELKFKNGIAAKRIP